MFLGFLWHDVWKKYSTNWMTERDMGKTGVEQDKEREAEGAESI